jgi:hypothetical protein
MATPLALAEINPEGASPWLERVSYPTHRLQNIPDT